MFYLLENKRIISDEEIEYGEYQKRDDGLYAFQCETDEWFAHWYKIDVLKQSENVCDLIEINDLVRFEGRMEEIENINDADVGTNYRCEYREDFDAAVTAIYKPRGEDYILVWKK